MPPGKPPFIKTPTPIRRPGWRDGEDPIPDLKPKPPPEDGPKNFPESKQTPDGFRKVTLGWADEPAAPSDYAEIIRRAAAAPRAVAHTLTVEAQGDWKSILSAARDGDPVPDELDDAAPCPDCVSEPCHACIAEEE